MRRESLLIAAYILAVTITTGITGALGPLASVIDSFFGIGLVIVLRNKAHDMWEPKPLKWLLVLILMGTAGSLAVNAAHPRIALASGVAFIAANLACTFLYAKGRCREAIVAFALVDSLLFPPIAFGAFTWWVVGGQVVAKISGAAVWMRLLTKI